MLSKNEVLRRLAPDQRLIAIGIRPNYRKLRRTSLKIRAAEALNTRVRSEEAVLQVLFTRAEKDKKIVTLDEFIT